MSEALIDGATKWEPAKVKFSDGLEHYAVVDGNGEIVCLTGRVGAEDAKGEQTAHLLASVPETALYVTTLLHVLGDLVKQYPENVLNVTPAGKAARDVLAVAAVTGAMKAARQATTPQPEGEPS